MSYTNGRSRNPFQQAVNDSLAKRNEPEVDVDIIGFQEVYEKDYRKLDHLPTFKYIDDNGEEQEIEIKGELTPELLNLTEVIQLESKGELPNRGRSRVFYIVKESNEVYGWDSEANEGVGCYVPILVNRIEEINRIDGGDATNGK